MLTEHVRNASKVRGWHWSGMRTRMGDLGWSYPDVLQEHVGPSDVVLDIGTGGGEIFSAVARAQDVAVDFKMEMLEVAREHLPCRLVAGDHRALPLVSHSFDVVADRHVGADAREVLRVLRSGGRYVTQQPGDRICQNIFDAFGWGTNGDFWRREAATAGEPYWGVTTAAEFFVQAGCEILRQEEAYVDYEFLNEESLAFWLRNAPLPQDVDPDRHADVLATLPLKTNWHAELLVVRVP
jgi:SAM-dependent methyltransferase